MDTKELEEMKELGVVKRRSEGPGKYEYSFKVKCKDCGQTINFCFCAESLEGAKKVMEAKPHRCEACNANPNNMSESTLRRMCELILENEFVKTWEDAFDALTEEWADAYDEPYELDGTEYWNCECPVSFDEPDQTE